MREHTNLLQVHNDTIAGLTQKVRELATMTEKYTTLPEDVTFIKDSERKGFDAKRRETMAMIDAMSKQLEDTLDREHGL